MPHLLLTACFLLSLASSFTLMAAERRPKVLLITADDLNWNSVGCFGATVPGTTPNIDRFAGQAIRFERAHVTCAVCMPSRSVLATGLYPHNNGIEGFNASTLKKGTPTIMKLLSEAGYRTGVLGKVEHSSAGFRLWDEIHDQAELGQGRDATTYGRRVEEFIANCGDTPFYLMANSHDPHRPFYNSDQEKGKWKEGTTMPSKIYGPEEVAVPGFLPDLAAVRLEVSEYFSSVRRCDDTVGAILEALERSGKADNTLVLFLSDNGMALPYAKTNCYLHSTRTPWIMRLPGVTTPGSVDREHFASGIDWLPTVAEVCGIEVPPAIDGRSLLPLLRGETQAGRDRVFTEFNETSGRQSFPMRCVQDERFGYIFNPWSVGGRPFKNESQSGRTWLAMKAAANGEAGIAARVEFFSYRQLEELYDFSVDPDALHNLIDDPVYASVAERLRGELQAHLKATNDWAADMLAQRHDPVALKALVDAKQRIVSGTRSGKADQAAD
jgi:N-sulfoglucosamine sulfohydrolase